jgi:hypothetical protein
MQRWMPIIIIGILLMMSAILIGISLPIGR